MVRRSGRVQASWVFFYLHNQNKTCLVIHRLITHTPFFLSSGFPFFTVAKTRSPAPAAGSLLSRPLIPFTAMTYRFLAPVLSAQFITAPTGRPTDIRNFAPDAPLEPRVCYGKDAQVTTCTTKVRRTPGLHTHDFKESSTKTVSA